MTWIWRRNSSLQAPASSDQLRNGSIVTLRSHGLVNHRWSRDKCAILYGFVHAFLPHHTVELLNSLLGNQTNVAELILMKCDWSEEFSLWQHDYLENSRRERCQKLKWRIVFCTIISQFDNKIDRNSTTFMCSE